MRKVQCSGEFCQCTRLAVLRVLHISVLLGFLIAYFSSSSLGHCSGGIVWFWNAGRSEIRFRYAAILGYSSGTNSFPLSRMLARAVEMPHTQSTAVNLKENKKHNFPWKSNKELQVQQLPWTRELISVEATRLTKQVALKNIFGHSLKSVPNAMKHPAMPK